MREIDGTPGAAPFSEQPLYVRTAHKVAYVLATLAFFTLATAVVLHVKEFNLPSYITYASGVTLTLAAAISAFIASRRPIHLQEKPVETVKEIEEKNAPSIEKEEEESNFSEKISKDDLANLLGNNLPPLMFDPEQMIAIEQMEEFPFPLELKEEPKPLEEKKVVHIELPDDPLEGVPQVWEGCLEKFGKERFEKYVGLEGGDDPYDNLWGAFGLLPFYLRVYHALGKKRVAYLKDARLPLVLYAFYMLDQEKLGEEVQRLKGECPGELLEVLEKGYPVMGPLAELVGTETFEGKKSAEKLIFQGVAALASKKLEMIPEDKRSEYEQKKWKERIEVLMPLLQKLFEAPEQFEENEKLYLNALDALDFSQFKERLGGSVIPKADFLAFGKKFGELFLRVREGFRAFLANDLPGVYGQHQLKERGIKEWVRKYISHEKRFRLAIRQGYVVAKGKELLKERGFLAGPFKLEELEKKATEAEEKVEKKVIGGLLKVHTQFRREKIKRLMGGRGEEKDRELLKDSETNLESVKKTLATEKQKARDGVLKQELKPGASLEDFKQLLAWEINLDEPVIQTAVESEGKKRFEKINRENRKIEPLMRSLIKIADYVEKETQEIVGSEESPETFVTKSLLTSEVLFSLFSQNVPKLASDLKEAVLGPMKEAGIDAKDFAKGIGFLEELLKKQLQMVSFDEEEHLEVQDWEIALGLKNGVPLHALLLPILLGLRGFKELKTISEWVSANFDVFFDLGARYAELPPAITRWKGVIGFGVSMLAKLAAAAGKGGSFASTGIEIAFAFYGSIKEDTFKNLLTDFAEKLKPYAIEEKSESVKLLAALPKLSIDLLRKPDAKKEQELLKLACAAGVEMQIKGLFAQFAAYRQDADPLSYQLLQPIKVLEVVKPLLKFAALGVLGNDKEQKAFRTFQERLQTLFSELYKFDVKNPEGLKQHTQKSIENFLKQN